jgi:hypothetical protein
LEFLRWGRGLTDEIHLHGDDAVIDGTTTAGGAQPAEAALIDADQASAWIRGGM